MKVVRYLAFGVSILFALIPCSAKAAEKDTKITATIPLTLDNVAVSGATSSGATISWVTNGVSTSQVFYDSSPHSEFSGYALHSTFDPDLKYVHLVTLTGLASARKYHFRVRSTVDSLTATSGDAEFTRPSVGGTAG